MLIIFSCSGKGLLFGQANNNWSAAQTIAIPSAGFGLGNYSGVAVPLDNATLEPGEFIPSPIFQKSVWYTFTIATTREVSISMTLSGSDVSSTSLGFFVYRETSTIPSSVDLGFFTDGAVGATSTNECLTAGKYYIQICGSLPLSINVNPLVEISPTLSADVNDDLANPDNVGVVSVGNQTVVDWPCLSLQMDDEYFPAIGVDYLNYSKSYWIAFQTDSHVDVFSYSVSLFAGGNYSDQVAVRIFEAPLTLAGFNPADAVYSNNRGFHGPGEFTHIPCLLEPNTSYVMQVIGRRDYGNSSTVTLKHIGEGETVEPIPTEATWNAGNNFGAIVSTPMPGTTVSLFDYFSCSSQMSETVAACTNVIPPAGFTGINNITYDLTNWFTLNVTQESSLIVTAATTCQACPGMTYNHSMYLRVFEQFPNNNCGSFQVPADVFYEGPFNGSGLCYITCLPPGEYTLQIMGRSLLSGNPYDCVSSQFGRRHNISVSVVDPAQFEYGMAVADDVDEINNGQALQENIVYSADLAEFTCDKTILPDTTVCWSTSDRAVYRTLQIGDADNDAVQDSGMLIIRNYNYQNYPLDIASNAVLYQGDINSLAQSQGTYTWPEEVDGLNPLMGCNVFNQRFCGGGLYNMQRYCLTPGTYTLAQFGDSTDVGAVLQPTFEFRKDQTAFWNPAAPDNMGDLLSVGLYHTSQPDTFSCLDNPAIIDGINPCGRTKLIYREFYLSQTSQIRINEISTPTDQGGIPILVFSGQVSQVGIDGLSIVMRPEEYCQSGFVRWECESLPPGWYTVVTYGVGLNYDNNFEYTEANGYSRISSCGPGAEGLYSINYGSRITIELDTTASPGPFYHRPGLACEVPDIITYSNALTIDFPSPFTEYVLCNEYFKDSTYQSVVNDEIFVCENERPLDKVAYYVFTTDAEYFFRVRNLAGYRKLLYALDVTTDDSLQLLTAEPVIPCSVGFNDFEVCGLPAGTYSLLVFADTLQDCINATPVIDVSPINYSRFDFADRAYDFDLIPSDGVFHAGMVGDVHPTNPNLSPSNDFFYCTTGSFPSDPAIGCIGVHSDSIYGAISEPIYYLADPLAEQEALRRNLWYTFVVQGNGTATVEVRNLSSDAYANTFHVYATDVSGELPWSTITSSSPTLIDSTITDGLTLKAHNVYWGNCGRAGAIDFNVVGDPCDSLTKRRFYIVVDRFHPRDFNGESFDALNGQIDVRIRWNRWPVADYPGDECSDAVATQATTNGVFPACTIIDCHTNADPFWDLPENNDCMVGPVGRSSTWFKFNYNGPDVVDIGFQPDVTSLLNYGLPADIDYRVFYGISCQSLIAGTECAQSSYISNTIACVDSTTGDFYVEVSYPENATGTLCFNFSVMLNTNPNCIPFNPTAVEAYFQYDQVCTLDTVNFTNYSTVGLQMQYLWDFGHDNATSDIYSPFHVFPGSGDYLVTLTATNSFAGTSDVYTEIIHVVDSTDLMHLVGDTTICFEDTLTLGRDLFQATYLWSTGATTSTISVFEPGLYSVDYTIIGCPFNDEMLLSVFQLVPPIPDSIAICEHLNFAADFGSLDSISWVNSPVEIVETGLVQFAIYPNSIMEHPWIAYDQGCFVEGVLEVVELYAFVPSIPPWDSVFCENYNDVELPVFSANTIGFFEYNESVIGDLDGEDFIPGNYSMSYVYSDSISCPDTLEIPFVVLDTLPVVWVEPGLITCNDADTINLFDLVEDTTGLFYVTYFPNQPADFQSNTYVPSLATGNETIPNSYELFYQVLYNQECISSSFGQITLQPDPIIELNYGLQCESSYLELENYSYVNNGDIVEFVWYFENGEMQNISEPVFIDLVDTGYFSFELEATSNYGCNVVIIDSVFVNPEPQVDIAYSSFCQYDVIEFTAETTIATGDVQQSVWYMDSQFMSASPEFTWVFDFPGVYDVGLHAWSDMGCEGKDSIHVEIYPTPELTIVAPAICSGDTIEASLISSIPSTEILFTQWSVDGVENATDVNAISIPSTSSSQVEIVVYQHTEVGCEGYDSLLVDIYELPELQVLPTDLDYCLGDSVAIGCIPLADLPQVVQNTQWVFNNGMVFNLPSSMFIASSPGDFSAIVTVNTNMGCTNSFEVNNYIIVHPNPIADFLLSEETPTYYEDVVDIFNQSSSNVVEWNYLISDGFMIDVPDFSHQFRGSGYYEIRLAVEDQYGCADTATKSIEFMPDLIVNIPNSFTPDGDGLNDVFLPVIDGDTVSYYRLVVFDRWGTIIFESLDVKEAWQGDVRKNGYYAISDAYNYLLQLKTNSGYEKEMQGAILLLR